MRSVPLTVINGGINRQRTKGGARADALYDLVNGYCTVDATVVARPGTVREATLNDATRGLVSFDGFLHTFAHEILAVPDGYRLHVLHHPDQSEGYEFPIHKIHFAAPMMGALYVVAEFEDGQTFHYWLQEVNEWEADHHYPANTMVFPTEFNGLAYQVRRAGDPYPAWAAGVPRSDGNDPGDYSRSIIEPTVYNDFFYECVLTGGSNPRSGQVEPTWPLEEGAQVIEYADGGEATETPAPPEPPSAQTPQERIRERYDRGDLR